MSDLNYFNSESNSYSSGYYSMKYVVQTPRYDKNHSISTESNSAKMTIQYWQDPVLWWIPGQKQEKFQDRQVSDKIAW